MEGGGTGGVNEPEPEGEPFRFTQVLLYNWLDYNTEGDIAPERSLSPLMAMQKTVDWDKILYYRYKVLTV